MPSYSEIDYYKGREKLLKRVPEGVRRAAKKVVYGQKYATKPKGVMPNFLVIGQMKCGTSSLYYYLCKHPQIIEASEKELNYFNFHYELGTDFYSKLFPTADELLNVKQSLNVDRVITGEATPEYLLHPLAPKRVRELLPDVKLIVALRDPVERAFSHYKHACRFGMESLDFETAIDIEEDRCKVGKQKVIDGEMVYSYPFHQFTYLERGRYAEQLQRWFEYFPREQFYIFKAEDMYQEPEPVISEIFEFLNVEPCQLEDYPNRFVGKPGSMSDATRAKLDAYFAPHNEQLKALLGDSFTW